MHRAFGRWSSIPGTAPPFAMNNGFGNPELLMREGHSAPSVGEEFAGFADHVPDLGQKIFLLRWREGHRGVERGEANNRAVEMVERFFIDNGGDFSGNPAGAHIFVHDHDLVGAAHGFGDGVAIEWRACVDPGLQVRFLPC